MDHQSLNGGAAGRYMISMPASLGLRAAASQAIARPTSRAEKQKPPSKSAYEALMTTGDLTKEVAIL
jgi:hypothetical protein